MMEELYSAKAIRKSIRAGAKQLIKHFRGTPEFAGVTFIPTVVGGIYAAVDLTREISALDPAFPYVVVPIFASRYGDKMVGGSTVEIVKPRSFDGAPKDVVVVEDIIDGGETSEAIAQNFLDYEHFRSVWFFSLARREGGRIPPTVNLLNTPLVLPQGKWGVGNGMSDDRGFYRGITCMAAIPL